MIGINFKRGGTVMKENELRKHTNCSRCGEKILHTGLPFFWTITVNRYGVDMGAVKRNAELAGYFGGGHYGSVFARVMGPDEDMAEKVMDTVTLTLCEDCAMKPIVIPLLCEGNKVDRKPREE
jgi:hypothetical protein